MTEVKNQVVKKEVSALEERRDALNMAFTQARYYAKSTIVPIQYQNNESNCFIAIEMANRMGANPFQVMQSLNIIQGKPSWSSQFIIAAINQSGRFKTQLNYKMTGSLKDRNLSCIAFATANDGTLCESIPVTYDMAKAEGWIDKKGSKWLTMPELMIRYRAASFFGRQFCPDLLLGLLSTEEIKDFKDADFVVLDNKEYENKPIEKIQEEQTNQIKEAKEQVKSDNKSEVKETVKVEKPEKVDDDVFKSFQ